MKKTILDEYVDACILVADTRRDIERIQRKKTTMTSESVKGSQYEFPYVQRRFKVEGMEYGYGDDKRLREEQKILHDRIEKADKLRLEVEQWMNGIPFRMQRIIKYKFMDGMSWDQTADEMGRGATGDSLRMELDRFLKKN